MVPWTSIIHLKKVKKVNKICSFSEAEFLVGLGLTIGAVEYGSKGSRLWLNGKKKLRMMNGILFCLTPTLITSCLSIASNNVDSFSHPFMKHSHLSMQEIHGGNLLVPLQNSTPII
jgi:hypothetical protein